MTQDEHTVHEPRSSTSASSGLVSRLFDLGRVAFAKLFRRKRKTKKNPNIYPLY